MHRTRVDLNADVGERSAADPPGQDSEIVPHITSANIACGAHAGDEIVMRETVARAQQYRVAIGAHPSLHDRAGFGRRELPVTPGEVERLVTAQIATLARIAAAAGATLRHVKPHGALYNMAARDAAIADAIARAVVAFDRSLLLFGLAGSALIAAGVRAGLETVAEAFPDRAYLPDGSLMPRSQPGAVIDDPDVVAAHAVALVNAGRAQTLCIHGDHANAGERAARVRAALDAAGVLVAAPRVGGEHAP